MTDAPLRSRRCGPRQDFEVGSASTGAERRASPLCTRPAMLSTPDVGRHRHPSPAVAHVALLLAADIVRSPFPTRWQQRWTSHDLGGHATASLRRQRTVLISTSIPVRPDLLCRGRCIGARRTADCRGQLGRDLRGRPFPGGAGDGDEEDRFDGASEEVVDPRLADARREDGDRVEEADGDVDDPVGSWSEDE